MKCEISNSGNQEYPATVFLQYNFGSVYRRKDATGYLSGDLYIMGNTGNEGGGACLISLETGNRWREPSNFPFGSELKSIDEWEDVTHKVKVVMK